MSSAKHCKLLTTDETKQYLLHTDGGSVVIQMIIYYDKTYGSDKDSDIEELVDSKTVCAVM